MTAWIQSLSPGELIAGAGVVALGLLFALRLVFQLGVHAYLVLTDRGGK